MPTPWSRDGHIERRDRRDCGHACAAPGVGAADEHVGVDRARRSSCASRHATSSANARAIAAYLGLDGAATAAITTLPLHYCYGLSVLHSHLVAGASVVAQRRLGGRSCFAAAIGTRGVTNVAGVPHTFDLIGTAGPNTSTSPPSASSPRPGADVRPPVWREWVERYARIGVSTSTRCTARPRRPPASAYLPPALASTPPAGDRSSRSQAATWDPTGCLLVSRTTSVNWLHRGPT